MDIDTVSDDYSLDRLDLQMNHSILWNGKEVEIVDKLQRETSFPKMIHATFEVPFSRKSHTIQVMGGSATVSVEKEADGEAEAKIEITATSEDGRVEISGSASVDQNGNTSGKIEATINWQRD